jgi:RNA polymerase sigma-70 factor (ECF subfamily)
MDDKKEKFSLIYREYIDKIYRFVYLKVNSKEIAEDLTSKIFLKGWESFNKKADDEIKNFGSFLYQIARNTVIDYYRVKDRTRMVPLDSIGQPMDEGKDSQEKAILNADIEQIKGGIQKLKKEYQDIIIWHYLDDMPIDSIAKLVGRPEGTVRVMLHRGLKDLKDIVQED